MTPQIYVSTSCLPGVQPLLSRVREFHHHGMTAIELGAGVRVDGSVDALLSEAGGRLLIHNYFPPPATSFVLNLASGDVNVRQRSIEMVTAALALSARVGAPFYSVHAGFITDPIGSDKAGFLFPLPQSEDERKHAMERFIDALRGLLTRAADVGPMLLVENNVCAPVSVGKLLLQSAGEFVELFAALPDPHLGMLLDTGHLNVSARTLGFDRGGFVNTVAPFARAFHIHDNDGTADTHGVAAPGSWVLDLLHRPVFRGLPIVIESKFQEGYELGQYVEWLRGELTS